MKKKIVSSIMIILGVILFIAHECKWVPAGYEQNDIIFALTYIYAYTGPFIGMTLIVYGVMNIREWKFLK